MSKKRKLSYNRKGQPWTHNRLPLVTIKKWQEFNQGAADSIRVTEKISNDELRQLDEKK